MKIKHLLREQAQHAAKQTAELQSVLAALEKLSPSIEKVFNDNRYEFEDMESQLISLQRTCEESNLGEYVYDVNSAIQAAQESIVHAYNAIHKILDELHYSMRIVSNNIEQIENDEEYERQNGQQVNEDDFEVDEAKASRALCIGSKPDDQLGASQLASCKSQGFRARDGKKSHLVGKERITVGGHKIKGKKYGGPLPDHGTRKDQR